MASRLFVHEAVVDKFIAILKASFETSSQSGFGDPTDAATKVGPLADEGQFKRVMDYIKIGTQESELITGGNQHSNKGLFVEPTIFKNPPRDSRILREEIFGPVITVQTFKTEDEAIKLANDTIFGLSGKSSLHLCRNTCSYPCTACVYTSSISRALRVTREIEAGTIAVNDWYFPSPDTPFGGVKQSGYGREGGLEGLNDYLQTKTIQIK